MLETFVFEDETDLFLRVGARLKFLTFGPAGALFSLPALSAEREELCLQVGVSTPDLPSESWPLPEEEIPVATALNIFWREFVLRGILRHDLVAYGSGIDAFLPESLRGYDFLQSRATIVRRLTFKSKPVTIWCGRVLAMDPTCSETTREHCLAVFDQVRRYADEHGYLLQEMSFYLGVASDGLLAFGGDLGVPSATTKFCDKEEARKLFFGPRQLPTMPPGWKFFERLTGQTLRSFQWEEMGIE